MMNLEQIKEAFAKLSIEERAELQRWFKESYADEIAASRRQRTLELERQHREGYLRKPVAPGEFDLD
jgi:hypothetical protein